MRSPTLFFVAAGLFCVLAAPLAAQQDIRYTDGNVPSTGGGNAFPWGSDGVRYQQIIPQSVLTNVPGWIHDIFVTGRGADNEIHYGDIEIRMGITQQTTLTTNWSTNNPNPVTVYRGPLRVRFLVDTWTAIGLPNSYFWLPKSASDNLCLEVIVWKVLDKGNSSTGANFYSPHVSSSQGRAFRYQWTTNQTQAPLTGTNSASRLGLLFTHGNSVPLGKGCKGSGGDPTLQGKAGTWPAVGKPFFLELTQGPATRPFAVFLGATPDTFASIPLPFDLAPLGASGCMVWNEHLLTLVSVTDAKGMGQVVLTVPPALSRLRLHAYGWCLDPGANQLGWTTSSLVTMIWAN